MRPARVFSTILLGICPSPREIRGRSSHVALERTVAPALVRCASRAAQRFGSEAPPGRAQMGMQRFGSFTVSWIWAMPFTLTAIGCAPGEVCGELRSSGVTSRFRAVLPKDSCARSATMDPLTCTPIHPNERPVRGHRVSLRVGRDEDLLRFWQGLNPELQGAGVGLAVARGEHLSPHAEGWLSPRNFLRGWRKREADSSQLL